MESTSGTKKKRLSPSSISQIQILNALANGAVGGSNEPRRLEITEIAERSGLRDEKETQRFLFILEGQKLVSPCPEGDFTSKIWQITSQGVQTLRQISSVMSN
jgi:DNA-binding IclR family transcriptional regulator